MLQLVAVKTIPKAAPRGEKVSVAFFFNPDAQNICSRNLFPYSEIRFMKMEFHQGNNYPLVDDFLCSSDVCIYFKEKTNCGYSCEVGREE